MTVWALHCAPEWRIAREFSIPFLTKLLNPKCGLKRLMGVRTMNRRNRIASVALALLLGTASTSYAVEPERVQKQASSPLLQLAERSTMTVAVAPLAASKIDVRVGVAFIDAHGRIVSTTRGVVGPRSPSFLARLPHDELDVLDAAQVRVIVRSATAEPVDGTVSCPIGTTLDTGSGPVLTWTDDACECGPTVGGHVFLNCTNGPGSIGTSD